MAPRQVVYLRFPVPRNGFVDPQGVNWSEAKEEKLWAVLSKSKKTEFGVPIKFLQQQAYWLYENELNQLRSRMEHDASLSRDTITDQGGSRQTLVKGHERTIRHINMFDSSKTSRISTSNLQSKSLSSPDRDVDRYHDPSHESDSGSESSSSSSLEDVNAGSMLLQRSRILSKAPPKFLPTDEEDEDDPLFRPI
ncbi:Autophagy-related protein 29 [Cyberlindnera fabianii]|uniref:Autophagy-related protein 29 n=1 Tax=Cyberlindnera fabianii TaxID=36022 RepID=A0A1V2L989_CYBFA|nr:Autophagy-related protein 29 [Cyberlindnera fabianii]